MPPAVEVAGGGKKGDRKEKLQKKQVRCEAIVRLFIVSCQVRSAPACESPEKTQSLRIVLLAKKGCTSILK
jgi:hypothetical protein